ncbi:cytochrome P450 [Aspergillus karnatakaensis]|uniref:cytochrome P450 n=1 Tax=Aspergillus karnatakaensis TaxID=1810916 RepID=UPI003CCCFB2C
MLYGQRNTLYERALQSHRRHAERWGYGMEVLQEEISVGYWNKPNYLLYLVLRELTRPAAERVEWLMWVDADSIILNPAIPLDLFLPPVSPSLSHIHLLATKDHKGLNTGIFFLHVHPWTIQFLTVSLAYPLYNPSANLGPQADQSAMEKVLSQETYRSGVVYLPRTWINAYEWKHDYEGAKGNLLVHFPGLEGERGKHMEKWLDVVERTPSAWEVPIADTGYAAEVAGFWAKVEMANSVLGEFEKRKTEAVDRGAAYIVSKDKDVEIDAAVAALRKVLYEEPFDGELLQRRIEDCRSPYEMQYSVVMGNLPSLVLALGLVYFLTLAQRVRKNPLSSIPGPEITKWTDFFLKYYTVTGQRPRYVHALHQKYGPIVRVAPSIVDIADIPSAREIHRIASPYLKSHWYRLLNRKDGESIFSTTDPEFHRRHRRLLSSPLSDTNLRTLEPLVRSRIQLAIDKMADEAASPRGVADVYKWFFFMATDIIGELSFGDSFRMLERGVKNQYIADIETVAKIGGIRATFPWVVKLATLLPLKVFHEVVASTDRILSYAIVSVERYKKRLEENPDGVKTTLFTRLFEAGVDKGMGEEFLSDREIRNDAQSFIIAGSDTTANTLTYLVWSVLKDDLIRERLVAELQVLGEKLGDDIEDGDLRDLPYFNQVINESLRLYPAVPSGLPRMVPEKGSALAGYWLPGGSTVTTQLYSLHRDEEVFEDPLNCNADSKDCVGIHLAKMELRLATALFFRTFPNAKVSTLENMSDRDMDMNLYFLLSPKGKRCLVEV